MAGSPFLALGARRFGALGVLLAALASPGCARSDAITGDARQGAWPGADLFADATVNQIRLEVSASDLERLRKESREFVRATITAAGAAYRDVGVHLKGSVGSFRPIDDRPGFTLDFSRFDSRQRFHGLRRIHLNNSVEDQSYCNQQLGSELFRAAGIPAPRVGRAVVSLNGRRLGLYLLVEGFTEDFLACYFEHPSGDLFEPGEGHDVNQRLKSATLPLPGKGRPALHRLAQAALEPDLQQRWLLLQKTVDVGRFANFMALEVMLCHRDGYCLARNNFRVYQDQDTGKAVFFPQGMDQLFGVAEMPWLPHMAGLVAQSFVEVPEGQARYRGAFTNLFKTLFKPDVWSHRVDQLTDSLRPAVEEGEFTRIKTEAAQLKQRILGRQSFLETELFHPATALSELEFTNDATRLAGWFREDESAATRMEQVAGPDNVRFLRIQTQAPASASWRTRARLGPGRYRFQGRARVVDVKPLGFGAHQGAGLRIAGQARSGPDLVGTSPWSALAAEFEVSGAAREIEFICELRADSGEACFEEASLQVVRKP